MKILDFFRGAPQQKRTAAQVAKERLQIIVSHESRREGGDFIKELQAELLDVISKYVKIDKEQIKVQLDQKGDQSVLELNVTLPESNMEMNITLPGESVQEASAEKPKKAETSEA